MSRRRHKKAGFKKSVGLTLLVGLCLAAAGCGTAGGGVEVETETGKPGTDPSGETEVEKAMAETEEAELIEEAELVEEAAPEAETEPEEAEPEEIIGPEESEPEEIVGPEESGQEEETEAAVSELPGAALNGTQFAEGEEPLRVTYAEGFYYEPISDALLDLMTGSSYPETDGGASLAITPEDLRYVHVRYCDFDGEPAEGELICNAAIAQDLVEIFFELYENGYQIEQIHLVDEYGGDDNASMAADNTSCFNYRNVANSSSLSRHALGLAIDINPLYNPYLTYNSDGSLNCSPEEGWPYADRSVGFSHKIDSNDLCYRLFTEHGFTWGGSWNSSKDYQHFQQG